MKQTLVERAQAILQGRTKAANAVADQIAAKRSAKEKAILESFLGAFQEYIPMIQEEGIKISAGFNSQYDHHGSYIQFEKNGIVLRMDYADALSYRYEYIPMQLGNNCSRYGRSVFGSWPKEDLILYIYDELLSKIEGRD